jgi:hypothetical protein
MDIVYSRIGNINSLMKLTRIFSLFFFLLFLHVTVDDVLKLKFLCVFFVLFCYIDRRKLLNSTKPVNCLDCAGRSNLLIQCRY